MWEKLQKIQTAKGRKTKNKGRDPMSKADPSFFKVLSIMDFTESLRLPPGALKKYELHASEDVKLRSHSGRRWKVKVERMKNGGFCFNGEGWKRFAEDAALQLGEFLIFSQHAKSLFLVEIYTTDFCKRLIPPTGQAPSSSNAVEDQTPSFMMFRLQEFRSELCILVKFVAKYKQFKDGEVVKVETDGGKSREAKIKKDKNGDYYMKEGWTEFMKENDIDDLDFLIFDLVGDSTFNVKIYRCDGCLREPTLATISDESESETKVKRKRGRPRKFQKQSSPLYFEKPPKIQKQSNPLYFEERLAPHHMPRFSLPYEFTRATNMREQRHVKLEFVATHNCKTVVVNPHKDQGGRVDMAYGWPKFREENGMARGKAYSFEYKPQANVIHVKKVIDFKK